MLQVKLSGFKKKLTFDRFDGNQATSRKSQKLFFLNLDEMRYK